MLVLTMAAPKKEQKLIQMAPREACLHFHLGKVLMPTEPQTALVHFHRALDLDKDTKDQQMIKSHIDLLKNAAEQAASGGKPGVAEAPRTPVRSEPGSVRARVTRREPAALPPRARPATADAGQRALADAVARGLDAAAEGWAGQAV